MKKLISIIIILIFSATCYAQKDVAISKTDTIFLLQIQSQVVQARTQIIDSITSNGAAFYIQKKIKNMLKKKYVVSNFASAINLNKEQYLQLGKTYKQFQKNETENILPANLSNLFLDSTKKFQMLVVNYGEFYLENPIQQTNSMAITNGNNTLYVMLVNSISKEIVYFQKAFSVSDARAEGQLERQVMACLKKLYYN